MTCKLNASATTFLQINICKLKNENGFTHTEYGYTVSANRDHATDEFVDEAPVICGCEFS